MLVSPLLLPVFALLAFTSSGGAASAAVEKIAAEATASSALEAKRVADEKVTRLQNQLAEQKQEAQRKLEQQQTASVKRLKEAKAELRRNYDTERTKNINLEAEMRKCVPPPAGPTRHLERP